MSRTFRRRHYIGADVAWRFVCYYDFEIHQTTFAGYVRLQGEELKAEIRKWHSETRWTYNYAPPKSHRKDTTVVQRMFDKTELERFKKDSDYEPMCYDKMPMDYWD